MNRFRLDERGAGLLVHPTSLAGPFESGDLGPAAFALVDFVAKAGLRFWQMLPVGPAGPGYSPYASTSVFAGNQNLISLEHLVRDGLLDATDPGLAPATPADRADLGASHTRREGLLRKAFSRAKQAPEMWAHVERFREKNAFWLGDFAIFSAIKRSRNGQDFLGWPDGLRQKNEEAVQAFVADNQAEVEFELFVQARFDFDLSELVKYAKQRGVGLIGDAPIYVALDSAEVWAHPEFFQLDADRTPRAVAGVPPDAFSDDGQLWGNPLYDWEALQRQGFGFWIARLEHQLSYFDAVRLDHFIGFSRYYAIARGERSAKNGTFHSVPGRELFDAVYNSLGPVQLLAEDLGVVTDEVKALRDHFRLPGMNVMQFSFSPGAHAENSRPHHFPLRSSVYSGTHDNDTTAGWLGSPPDNASEGGQKSWRADRDFALKYLGLAERNLSPAQQAWEIVRETFKNQAQLAIVPVQDFLGLGREARMNRPGIATGNWDFRLRPGVLDSELCERIAGLARTYGRTATDS